MKRVVVASENPVKVAASEAAFAQIFPDEAFSFTEVQVESGVGDQPMTDDETLQGAMNRARNAEKAMPDADYWLGLEGGLELQDDGSYQVFAWMVAISASGKVGCSRTATFVLPPSLAELIDQGYELGDADDIVFGRTNSKQDTATVGILTGGAVPRMEYYAQAMALALIPHRNPELYP